MRKLLRSPVRISLAIIAGIVDIFSLIQIFKQTQFRMPQLFNSEWFWLFVTVTVATGIMLLYFKFQDYKRQIAEYKKGIEEYKGRVRDEFYKRMAEESNLHKRCNELGWKIEELKTQIEQMKTHKLVHDAI